MIHISTCRDCRRAWQDGAGARFRIGRAVLDYAECNGILCDDEEQKRATQTIPPTIRRLVLERAQHRCQFPGCRSSKHLTIHHIKFRSDGGTHDPANLIVLCDGHHRLLHDGHVTITGQPPDDIVFTRNGARLLGASTAPVVRELTPRDETHARRKHAASPTASPPRSSGLDLDENPVALATQALKQLGFKPATAIRAVEVASAHVGAEVDLESLIKDALRHCG